MPIIFEVVDFDAEFANITDRIPIVLNDLPNKTEQDRLNTVSYIRDVFTNDILSTRPSCACGNLRGEHLLGESCENCNTVVKPTIEEEIKPLVWFRAPAHVDRLINPWFYCVLRNRFNKKNCNILEWLLDKSYRLPQNYPDIFEKLILDKVPRGLNEFYRNFDSIFEYLINLNDFKEKSITQTMVKGMAGLDVNEDPLRRAVKDFRHLIFCRHIPIMNKMMLVIEKPDSKVYVEPHFIDIHNAINTMASIDKDHYEKKPAAIENRTARILEMLGDYYTKYIETDIKSKKGLPRRHVYGTRGNISFRAVITSHDTLHKHDHIYTPWGATLTCLWTHLMGILTRRNHPLGGLSHNEAYGLLIEHVGKYHPRIAAILDMFIKDAQDEGYPGICCMIQRNPTLPQGSAQRVWITQIKKNPGDLSVSMSDLIATAMNADYDGDETMFTIAQDKTMIDMFYPFSPFFNLLLLDKPFKISKNAEMTQSVVASVSHWLEVTRREATKT